MQRRDGVLSPLQRLRGPLVSGRRASVGATADAASTICLAFSTPLLSSTKPSACERQP